jgi:PilZ domain
MGSGDQGVRRFERRWAPRYRFRADLEIEWGSTVLRARTRDISSSGMFIESADPLWVGAGFSAQLTLDKPVKLNCFVKRVEPGRGMGVSIALAEDQHQETFQELINHLSGNQP